MYYSCTKCGWYKIVYPASDNHTAGLDMYTTCLKCGSEELIIKAARKLQVILDKFRVGQ